MKLRVYQQQAIREIFDNYENDHLHQVLAMPTGSGKTATAADIIHKAAKKGIYSLFIVHRVELVNQAANHLQSLGLKVGIMQGENTCRHSDDEVIIATVQTLRRQKIPPRSSKLVFIDECHVLHKYHIELMERWNNLPFIGLSATPLRPDLGKYFTALVKGLSIRELTQAGYLVPLHAFCPGYEQLREALSEVNVDYKKGDYNQQQLGKAMNRKVLIGDLLTTWQKKAADRHTLIFAVDVAHAQSITEEFIFANISAACINYRTPAAERKKYIDGFRQGEIQVLVSVDVLGVGFDVPGASCGIMARPTISPMVYFQQVGRILRPADDKSDAILLDHAGNTIRFGLPIDFELPDLTADDRKVAKPSKKLKPKTKTCKHCDAVMLPTDFICPACGMDQPRPVSKVAYVDGDLIEFGSGKDGTREYSIADRKEFYLETRYLWEVVWNKSPDHACKIAFARSKQKFGIPPPWSWRSLAIKQVTPEVMNWNKSENIRYQHRRQ